MASTQESRVAIYVKDDLSEDMLSLLNKLLSMFKGVEVNRNNKSKSIRIIGSEDLIKEVKESLKKSKIRYEESSKFIKQKLIIANYLCKLNQENNYLEFRKLMISRMKLIKDISACEDDLKVIHIKDNTIVMVNRSPAIKNLLNEVEFKVDYLRFIQINKILVCERCGLIGHLIDKCTKQIQRVLNVGVTPQ